MWLNLEGSFWNPYGLMVSLQIDHVYSCSLGELSDDFFILLSGHFHSDIFGLSQGSLALWIPILVSLRWTADRSWSHGWLWDTLGIFGEQGEMMGKCPAGSARNVWESLRSELSCALQPGLASFSKVRRSSAMRELPKQSFRKSCSIKVGLGWYRLVPVRLVWKRHPDVPCACDMDSAGMTGMLMLCFCKSGQIAMYCHM